MPFTVLHDTHYMYIYTYAYILCRLQCTFNLPVTRQCHTPTDNFPFLFTKYMFKKGRGISRLIAYNLVHK